jgi:hypothetical protein
MDTDVRALKKTRISPQRHGDTEETTRKNHAATEVTGEHRDASEKLVASRDGFPR